MSIATQAELVREPAEAYHADRRRFSRSQLWDYQQSTYLFFKRHVEHDPDWKFTGTEDTRFGSAFHAITLEGAAFDRVFRVVPEHVLSEKGERRGKPYQLWESITPGADEYIRPKDAEPLREKVRLMTESLEASEPAMALLCAPGHPALFGESPIEIGIRWEHLAMDLRTRIDRLNADCIVDLKTTRNADLGFLERTIETAGYGWQAGFYQQAVEELTGERMPFKFVFVESSQPFRTVTVNIAQEWMDAIRQEIPCVLRRLQKNFESGNWRDPSGATEITMNRPNWTKWSWALTETEEAA